MSFKDKSKSENAIFSLRIVSIDSYMTAPLFGLDTCYSEFRGNEIKQVPVIRIFGTDDHSVKTCAHIHGVFPYLYVPYAGDSTTNDENRLAYQLASSLDKAINISLGQANSTTQHIFKIVVVKGLPFYGYHQNEHKYMKIFLYNPTFVRRAANLLQNGAILSRIFQPHESHVSYILQFMIDYNLYGMSFLHVPVKLVRYRQRSHNRLNNLNLKNDSSADVDRDLLEMIHPNQILDAKIERISTSKQEIDLDSAFILNRLQIASSDDSNEHANPGIAFLWRDERGRRSQMSGDMPPLVVTKETPESRGIIPSTESEIFHKNALNKRMECLSRNAEKTSASESISNESQNSTSFLDQSRKFNLNHLLKNAVYPAEYSPNESIVDSDKTILNASHIVDHLQSTTLSATNQSASNVQFDLDETIVDEELVLSLTQKFSNTTLLNETLDREEHEVLDILEVLDGQDRDEQIHIDDDSVLAPLSQVREPSQKFEENYAVESAFDAEDSDDDLLNEFSMSILDCVPKDLSTNIGDEFKIPQMDGACDSPRKNSKKKPGPKSSRLRSPSRSNKKYAPLNVVVTRSPSTKINGQADDESQSSQNLPIKIPTLCIEKCDSKPVTSSSSSSSSADPTDTDKKSIKRETKANKTSDAIRSLFEMPDEHRKIIENSPTVILTRYEDAKPSMVSESKGNNVSKQPVPSSSGNGNEIKSEKELTEANGNDETKRRYPKRDRKPRVAFEIGNPVNADSEKKSKPKLKRSKNDDDDEGDDLEKMDFWYSWYEWSDCEISKKYDRERNFFPQPGPSTLNYYEDEDLTGYYRPVVKETPSDPRMRKRKNATGLDSNRKTKFNKSAIKEFDTNDPLSPLSSDNSDWENGIEVQSFYEQSFAQQNSATKFSRSPNVIVSPIPKSSPHQNIDENSDPNNTSISMPMMAKILKNVLNTSTVEKPRKLPKHINSVTIKPVEKPSNHNETVRTMNAHNIHETVHPIPFYSDPNDVIADSTRKEIGNTILQLKGESVNDCEEFRSQMNLTGIHRWQHLVATSSTSRKLRRINNKGKTFDDDINAVRKILTKDNKIIKIKPTLRVPKSKDSKKWLAHRLSLAKEKSNSSAIDLDTKNHHQMEVDSPVKVRREKATTALQDSDDDCKIIDDYLGLNGCISDIHNNDHVNRLLHNKNITLSVVSKSGKKEAILSRPSDDDSDDVICLDDGPVIISTNATQHVSMTKIQSNKNLERPSFVAHLNLDDTINKTNSQNMSFGIKGAVLNNSYGFRMNLDNFQCAKSVNDHNHLTIMSLEIHCQTRLALRPDPAHDEITCIFYAIHNDVPSDNQNPRNISGGLVNANAENDSSHRRHGIPHIHIKYFPNEKALLLELVRLVHFWDPDIFAGYEIELASWGYIIQRSQTINMEIVPLISRIPSQKSAKIQIAEQENVPQEEFHGIEYDSKYKLHGRILLDVWRLLRGEIALTSYSFESIMYHVLHRRYPKFSFEKLTRLWNTPLHQWIVIEYYMNRTIGTMEIMNQLDLVGRTCELAKLFGIQFYEVLSRGSQFRVESMMLRIAKPKNLIPVSPSVQQRAYMRAPEYIPLILEPHSRFYADPLIVLDFQSLYPSMIIAYNYCFSTCLGRAEHLGPSQPFEFGASQLRVPRRLIERLIKRNSIHISPSGAVFVKPSVREGVLPRMLREILDTRLMVKQSMKLHKSDKLLQRILHSRQLGLKLMANVTYGYTAANFSGRMPCVEVGDSVVSKGRETLERAIKTVESNNEWGCRVVYGDTDSMFVLVPGRSREEAFRIGSEIAKTVTQQNPFPVCLKLEKVYQPSILQTKKRYVGFMYESAEQSAAIYEAKGIETVRRDGCPAVAKMLEKTLRIIFETCDISIVKRYVCRQFTKILAGRANIQDLIFAKEFRGIRGYKPGACVPALELTRTALKTDPRSEPRRGERVPYLVIHGPPGLPLIRLVRSPHEYLSNEALKINAMYYITKVLIPPLNRCLLLIGADANQWFADLPRKSQYLLSLDIASNVMTKNDNQSSRIQLFRNDSSAAVASKKSTISEYFSSTNCVCGCGKHTLDGICSSCLQPNRRQQSALILADKCMRLERKLLLCQDICKSCCGHTIDNECNSLDCSILFVLNQSTHESKQIHFYRQLIDTNF